MREVKSTAEACYDARMTLIKERDELARQVSELQLSQQNIINAFGIKGEGAHSKLVIEYVLGLVAENAALKARTVTVPEKVYVKDMKCNVVRWAQVIDALSNAGVSFVRDDGELIAGNRETPATGAAIAEIKAQGVDDFIAHCQRHLNVGFHTKANRDKFSAGINTAAPFAANLRAGRKG